MSECDNKEFTNEPVFYGPDGKILTEEENAFLWNACSGPNDGYEDEVYVFFFVALTSIKTEMGISMKSLIIFLQPCLLPVNRNDPDALVEIEPEMDLEIQLAFKDFVSYQNKKWYIEQSNSFGNIEKAFSDDRKLCMLHSIEFMISLIFTYV